MRCARALYGVLLHRFLLACHSLRQSSQRDSARISAGMAFLFGLIRWGSVGVLLLVRTTLLIALAAAGSGSGAGSAGGWLRRVVALLRTVIATTAFAGRHVEPGVRHGYRPPSARDSTLR